MYYGLAVQVTAWIRQASIPHRLDRFWTHGHHNRLIMMPALV
jgi:hypothetical protein